MKVNIFKNSIWLLLERVYGIANGLLVGVIVVRYLGPELNGQLAYTNSLFSILSFMATLGLSSVITKELVENPKNKIKCLVSSLILQAVGSLFMGGVVIAYFYMFTSNNLVLPLLIWISWFVNRTQVFAQYFESKVQAKVYVLIKLVTSTASLLVKVAVVYFNEGVIGIGVSYVVESILYAILIFTVFYKDIKGQVFFLFDWQYCKSLIKKGMPLLLAAVATPLFMQMDIIMLGNMVDTYSVGIYNAATKISMPLYFFMGVIVTSHYPLLIEISKKGNDYLDIKIKYLIKVSYMLSCLVVLPLCFFSKEIVSFLYGNEFIETIDVLRVHAISIIFAYLAPIGSRWLMISNNLKHEFYKTLCGAVINILLNVIFIKEYGVVGAAIASVIAYFVSNFLYFIFPKSTRKLFWYMLCLK